MSIAKLRPTLRPVELSYTLSRVFSKLTGKRITSNLVISTATCAIKGRSQTMASRRPYQIYFQDTEVLTHTRPKGDFEASEKTPLGIQECY